MQRKILVIDDEEKLRKLLVRIIQLEGFEVFEAGNIKSGVEMLEQRNIDVVICDVKLPDGNGVDTIEILKKKSPKSEIILFTAFGNISDGVQAIKNGAFDYITKGDDNNKIIPLLFKAIEKVDLNQRVFLLENQLENKFAFGNIIGNSSIFRETLTLAEKVAPTDTNVLLLGETGTGKEVFAQAIHVASKRNKKSFLAINCSAFSKELLESELFGHKSGAFTGANKDKKGLFEEAHNGTLFLDEIGEMAFDLQAKLLRVLESGEFIKIGESKITKVNVRIIAATNRSLEDEIRAGTFRSDLFYRLSTFTIHLPPLRERREDIPLLINDFIPKLALKIGKKVNVASKAYLDILQKYNWSGNIRELKNVLERSIILADVDTLDIDTLPYEIAHSSDHVSTTVSAFALNSIEKLHIQKVLNYTSGNKAEAARLLEIGVATLYRKLDEYKINP